MALNLAAARPLDGGGRGCHRCGGSVFPLESVNAGESESYHRKCATCKACNKQLDARTMNVGNDKVKVLFYYWNTLIRVRTQSLPQWLAMLNRSSLNEYYSILRTIVHCHSLRRVL